MNVFVAPKTIPRMIIAARKAHALSKIQATATAISIPKMVAGTTQLSMRVPPVDYGARRAGLMQCFPNVAIKLPQIAVHFY